MRLKPVIVVAAAGIALICALVKCENPFGSTNKPPVYPWDITPFSGEIDAGDSAVVVAILKANGIGSEYLRRVIAANNVGRVTGLHLVYGRLPPGTGGIAVLSPEIGQIAYLESLHIDPGSLEELPHTVGMLGNLRVLNVSYCSLRSIPEQIGSLSLLERLQLNRNLLTWLPDSLVACSRLRSLRLENNNLESLPDLIGRLEELQELRLGYNRLTGLPASIIRLSKVVKYNLDLRANRLCSLPDSIVTWIDRHAQQWRESQDCAMTEP